MKLLIYLSLIYLILTVNGKNLKYKFDNKVQNRRSKKLKITDNRIKKINNLQYESQEIYLAPDFSDQLPGEYKAIDKQGLSSYLCGYAIKVSDGEGDHYEGINGFKAIFCNLENWDQQEIEKIWKGGSGEWKKSQCPKNSFVTWSTGKYSNDHGLDGLSMICFNPRKGKQTSIDVLITDGPGDSGLAQILSVPNEPILGLIFKIAVKFQNGCKWWQICRGVTNVILTQVPIVCPQGTHYDKKILKCVKDIQFCQQYSDDGSCLECQHGFIYRNGICVKEVENCIEQIGVACQKCKKGYNLVEGVCKYLIKNCETQNKATCLKCKDGYYIENNKCEKKNQGCKLQLSGQCQECEENFILNATNECNAKIENCQIQIDKECQVCDDDFLSDDNGKCVQKIKNCKGQMISNVCSECKKGYILFDNQCVKEIKNCLKYEGDTCKECIENFNFVNGKCIEKKICRKYDGEICVDCGPGYTFDQNRECILDTSLCVLFNREKTDCSMCKYGFYLHQHVCYPWVKYCKNIDLGICWQCHKQFEIKDDGYKCQYIGKMSKKTKEKWDKKDNKKKQDYQIQLQLLLRKLKQQKP